MVSLLQIIQLVTKRLPQLASSSLWDEVLRATQLLLWLTHHVPGATILFIAAKGTARMQGAVDASMYTKMFDTAMQRIDEVLCVSY